MTTHQEAARPPRELVWNEYHYEQGNPDRWDAETPFNTYYGIALLHDGYSVQHDYAGVAKELQSLEDAKNAAKADCFRRCASFLAALAPSDNGLVVRVLDKSADTITAQAAEIDRLKVERDKANAWAKEQHASADRYAAHLSALEPLLDKAVEALPTQWPDVLRSRADATYLGDTEGTIKLLRQTADMITSTLTAIKEARHASE